MRLTIPQISLARRILASSHEWLSCRPPSPGREMLDRDAWYIGSPYSEADGRVATSMLRKGALVPLGGGDYALSAEARAFMEGAANPRTTEHSGDA